MTSQASASTVNAVDATNSTGDDDGDGDDIVISPPKMTAPPWSGQPAYSNNNNNGTNNDDDYNHSDWDAPSSATKPASRPLPPYTRTNSTAGSAGASVWATGVAGTTGRTVPFTGTGARVQGGWVGVVVVAIVVMGAMV